MGELLLNKVCVVTGAARGIGKEIALLYAEHGADVIVNDIQQDGVEEWINNSGYKSKLHPFFFDITDPEIVKENILKIKKEYGKIDVLVNNAAVEYNELIGMISSSNMEKMISVNICGTIQMIQAVSRVMSRNKDGGTIINISSMVGLRGNQGQLVYSATKGAVVAITKSAAKELARNNIRVNSIAPGLTQTDMLEKADIEKLRNRINNISLGRIAQPKDIAGGCLLLACDYAQYITGQVIPVDGCTIM